MGNSVTFRLKGCQFENFQKEKAQEQGEKIEPGRKNWAGAKKRPSGAGADLLNFDFLLPWIVFETMVENMLSRGKRPEKLT